MTINLRKANEADIEFLFHLRNNPDVFKYFKTPKEVEWKEHVKWITPVLEGKTNKELYIIGDRVGQIRFDDKKEVSISISKDYQGKGFGSIALEKALEIYPHLIAEIHKDNVASIRLFEKFGFKQKGIEDPFLIYES